MSKGLIGKVVAIFILVLLLMLFLGRIQHIVKERERYQEQVTLDIANSTSGAQRLIGPVLVVPYIVYKKDNVKKEDAATEVLPLPRAVEERYRFFSPQDLKVEGNVDVSARKLGIYQAQVYTAALKWQGSFGAIDFKGMEKQANFARFGDPYLVFLTSDARGLVNASKLTLNANMYSFEEGSGPHEIGAGFHVPLNIAALQGSSSNQFGFDIQIQGTKDFSVVPIGGRNDLKLTSNWPHPSFLGEMLPQTRDVSSKGFSAHWQSASFTNSASRLFADKETPYFDCASTPSFRVSMVEPVNQYQLNERSIKYGILFIGLTFIAFLMIELLSQLRIHPVQYSLVGAALVIFFLLLLALSEHIGFTLAYVIATLGCSGLIGIYLCSVLKSKMGGGSFTAGLLMLYALLFIILQSEDKAILLGSVLLFAVLSIIMLATRKVDWYALTDDIEAKKAVVKRADKQVKENVCIEKTEDKKA